MNDETVERAKIRLKLEEFKIRLKPYQVWKLPFAELNFSEKNDVELIEKKDACEKLLKQLTAKEVLVKEWIDLIPKTSFAQRVNARKDGCTLLETAGFGEHDPKNYNSLYHPFIDYDRNPIPQITTIKHFGAWNLEL